MIPTIRNVSQALTAQDGPAFRDLTDTPAPQSGDDDPAGFVLHADNRGVSVISTRRPGEKRSADMAAYADALRPLFALRVAERDGRVTAVKALR